MGYLTFKTNENGEAIVDASRILHIKQSASRIDLITNLFEGNASGTVGQVRIQGSNLTESTLEKFNQAVIEAQSKSAVAVLPSGSEVFNSIALDPS